MLGDTAVAVHPDNERYKHLIGKTAVLPLVGRRIPIVADDYADPEKGTGAVKITPAHDFNDFEVGKRHHLPMINVLDIEAQLDLDGNIEFLEDVPASAELDETLALHGLDRFEARKQIVARLEAPGLLGRSRQHAHGAARRPLRRGDRAVPDRPVVRRRQDAGAAGDRGGRDGRTVFVPKNWEKTYFEWMQNIQPWCISRQLWWGHRIPAWYGPDGRIFVAETEEEAVSRALAYYAETEAITPMQAHDMALDPESREPFLLRDEDVLDTWFSSALWPFSTLGWPDKTPELARYYPTNTLVTGFDIIFFWVARMMMMGLHFMEDVPFDTVFINALVRDEKGEKMSKSKGNVIDPLELIDDYGADALRFTLDRHGGAGPRHQARETAHRGLPQLRHQAVERRRFAEMNGCARCRASTRTTSRAAQPLDRRRDRADGRRGHRGARGLRVQRGGERGLPLRLEHLLRLVRGARQAGAARAGGAGARPRPAPPPPGRSTRS